MIRADFVLEDVKQLFMTLFAAKQIVSPWDRWNFIGAYPNNLEFSGFADKKPLVFLEDFEFVDKELTQGQTFGADDTHQHYGYRMIMQAYLGVWLHKKMGGPKEMRIIKSHLNYLFNPPQPKLPEDTFNITFGETTYTDTTILEQGIVDIDLSGGRDIEVDKDEFRQEMVLTVAAIVGETETLS